MKRKILTVIIVCMLTCVMCMVLFACNKTQNQNEPDSVDSAIGGVYNDREGQFENYMASTEFSFGHCPASIFSGLNMEGFSVPSPHSLSVKVFTVKCTKL